MTLRDELAPLLRMLRRDCPVTYPVRVQFRNMTKTQLCGYCLTLLDDQDRIVRFRIVLDTTLPYLSVVDTLIHEWAHVVDQAEHGLVYDDTHRDSWGLCYAKIWRAYVRWVTTQ